VLRSPCRLSSIERFRAQDRSGQEPLSNQLGRWCATRLSGMPPDQDQRVRFRRSIKCLGWFGAMLQPWGMSSVRPFHFLEFTPTRIRHLLACSALETQTDWRRSAKAKPGKTVQSKPKFERQVCVAGIIMGRIHKRPGRHGNRVFRRCLFQGSACRPTQFARRNLKQQTRI